jgi:hypothetical protein
MTNDDTLWHKAEVLRPWGVKTIDGKRAFHYVWRRRTPQGWEYQKREESFEEWEARQW